MKRRYANKVEGDYTQKRVDEEYFKGYICNVKINDVNKPLIVNNGVSEICIKDNGYEWFEVYPDNENSIPYEDDLYLDMIITPDGQKLVLDEDELIYAFNRGEIMQSDVDLAYETLKKLEIIYVSNLDNLINLTNKFCEMFESKTKVK